MAKYTITLNDADSQLVTWALQQQLLTPPMPPGTPDVTIPQTENELLTMAFERYLLPSWRQNKSDRDAEVMRSALKDADPQTVDLTHQAIAAVQRMPPDQQKALLQQVIDQAPPVEENV